MRRAEIAERVRARSTGAARGLGERSVDQLSGGQQQRVALARAIVFEPRILLMDEPLSALDKKLREQMQIEIEQLHQRLGMTTVYVTHDQREALTMSDRIAVIDHGRFRQIDKPRDLYERPDNAFIAEFIGETHFLPFEVHDGQAASRAASAACAPRCIRRPPISFWRCGRRSCVPRRRRWRRLNVFEGRGHASMCTRARASSSTYHGGGPRNRDAPVARRRHGPTPPGTPVRVGFSPADTIIVPVLPDLPT